MKFAACHRRFLKAILFAASFFFALESPAPGAIEKGDPYGMVLAEFGKPESEIMAGSVQILVYDTLRVKIKDDKVFAVEKVKFYPTGSKSGGAPSHPTPKIYARKVVEIRNDGMQENIRRLIVPGKVTIVDFFADWCGPCRSMDPKLKKLAETNPDVYLRKVDIVNWQSPIVKQMGITFVPNVAVYDGSGKLMGKPTSRYSDIANQVRTASRRL